MKKEMTHTITLTQREGGFKATHVDRTVKCRLLTNHIIAENGIKYKKSDGLVLGAHTYRGVYMETTKVNPDTLHPIEEIVK